MELELSGLDRRGRELARAAGLQQQRAAEAEAEVERELRRRAWISSVSDARGVTHELAYCLAKLEAMREDALRRGKRSLASELFEAEAQVEVELQLRRWWQAGRYR